MEKIETLAEKTRKKISDFCINECCAFCCRKGYLTLSLREMNLIVGDVEAKLISEEKLNEMLNGKYSLCFENSLEGCPQLKDKKCLIHANSLRPKTCKDFPIFILGKKIKISNRCPAKADGKFFKFEHDAMNLGY